LGNQIGGLLLCGCHWDYFSVSAGQDKRGSSTCGVNGRPRCTHKSGSKASALQKKKWEILGVFDSVGDGH
jgi:hypothetical protein